MRFLSSLASAALILCLGLSMANAATLKFDVVTISLPGVKTDERLLGQSGTLVVTHPDLPDGSNGSHFFEHPDFSIEVEIFGQRLTLAHHNDFLFEPGLAFKNGHIWELRFLVTDLDIPEASSMPIELIESLGFLITPDRSHFVAVVNSPLPNPPSGGNAPGPAIVPLPASAVLALSAIVLLRQFSRSGRSNAT